MFLHQSPVHRQRNCPLYLRMSGCRSGVIDFWMFAVQVMAFRFLYGAILTVSPRNAVFQCILCHTMFNAASFTFGVPPTTWAGTITANAAVLTLAVAVVVVSHRSAAARQDRRLAS